MPKAKKTTRKTNRKPLVVRRAVDAAVALFTRLNHILPKALRIRVFKKTQINLIQEYEADVRKARRACQIRPKNQRDRLRLAHALAKLEQWDEAAMALSQATLPPHGPSFCPRKVSGSAAPYMKKAEEFANAGDWREAAHFLLQAIDRSGMSREALFLELGKAWHAAGETAKSLLAFRDALIERAVASIGATQVKGQKALETARCRSYALYYESAHTRPDLVLYETFHGKSVSCSPAAMLHAALEDPRMQGYTHIVVLNKAEDLPPTLAGRDNVITVVRESDRYRRFLCEAVYLINNTTFPPYFIRQPFQKYLNTWHGTPMKTLGKYVPGPLGAHRNAQRNFLQATHIISQNRFTTEKIVDSHDIPDCFEGAIAETGYPRVDVSINADQSFRDDLKRRLGIPPGRHVILFAPTWRGSLGAPEGEEQATIEVLTALALSHGGNAAVLYRGHHLGRKSNPSTSNSLWSVPDETIDTNELLSICDVLVSDYSSIIFDFLPLRRPVVLFAPDLEEYTRSRGFFLSPSQLGIPVCKTIQELVRTVNDTVLVDPAVVERYAGLEDGNSTRRALDFFFHNDRSCVVRRPPHRPAIVFFGGGLKKNGVTISLLTRLNMIDHAKFEVILVTMTSLLANDEDKLSHFRRIHPSVKVIDRGGVLCASPMEYLLYQRSLEVPGIGPEVTAVGRREALRIFGGMLSIDVAVDYGGYSYFWSLLLGLSAARRKLIYLHNDMAAERTMRFAELGAVFACYRFFDGFISVSPSSGEVNRRKLAGIADVCPGAFVHVPNPLDIQTLSSLANQELLPVHESLLAPRGAASNKQSLRFVNVARLSPEKGHARLLRAFAKVRATVPDISLFLVGDGPLRESLERLARKLELGESVHFLGQVDNPLPIVKACDAFIFSSVHEGQGLALIEALILHKVAVSTDIPGPRDVLANGLGLLVPDSEKGLVEGLLACINGWQPARRFSPSAYNEHAEALFEAVLLGEPVADDSETGLDLSSKSDRTCSLCSHSGGGA